MSVQATSDILAFGDGVPEQQCRYICNHSIVSLETRQRKSAMLSHCMGARTSREEANLRLSYVGKTTAPHSVICSLPGAPRRTASLPVQDGGRGLGHPGSIFSPLWWEGAGRPGRSGSVCQGVHGRESRRTARPKIALSTYLWQRAKFEEEVAKSKTTTPLGADPGLELPKVQKRQK